MVYSIKELPDDIICFIFSFLTIRDALIARLSSPQWRHLPETRSVVKLDSLNVFGKELADQDKDSPLVQSKFVKIAHRFMKKWAGKRMHTLIINFALGKEHSSFVRLWLAKSVGRGVEEIQLDTSGRSQQTNVFESTLKFFENAPYLKRLCLRSCTLCPSPYSWRTGRFRNLTSLQLLNVPLYQRVVDCILSACTNLISLELWGCDLPRYMRIDGQLIIRLMIQLTFHGVLNGIELNCPCLEVFEYEGPPISVRLVHVPVLREAKLWSVLFHSEDGCSSLFDHVGKQAPYIQSLSLMIRTEVKPSLLSMLATSRLKKLEIVVKRGFDLLSVTDLLNASPCLETLQLLLLSNSSIPIEKREYCDRSHSKLKEVKIRGFHDKWNAMELALYLLKNATALEQMTLVKHPTYWYSGEQVKFLQELKKINPAAQLIIPTRKGIFTEKCNSA